MTSRMIRYDCRRDAVGWTVFDRWTGRTVTFEGILRRGMDWDDADDLLSRLNTPGGPGERVILQ